jgi:phosphoribosylanthranilate isomerase
MHVKICGLTNLDDALVAVEAGADILGFNFYPRSPRCIAPEACARIVAEVARLATPVTTVGVFVNETPERVWAVLKECGLDLAQLHGDEPPEHLMLLWGRAYKALRGVRENDLCRFAPAGPDYPALLIDAHRPGLYGGTGETCDWDEAALAALDYPIVLAGGLTPENVGAAVRQVRPWSVDVASGVESAPGKKDAAKVRAFVREAQSLMTNHQSPSGIW